VQRLNLKLALIHDEQTWFDNELAISSTCTAF
jgi:hypothetical protein